MKRGGQTRLITFLVGILAIVKTVEFGAHASAGSTMLLVGDGIFAMLFAVLLLGHYTMS